MKDHPGVAERETEFYSVAQFLADASRPEGYDAAELIGRWNADRDARERHDRQVLVLRLNAIATDRSRSWVDRLNARRALSLLHADGDRAESRPDRYATAWFVARSLTPWEWGGSLPVNVSPAPLVTKQRTPHRAGRSSIHGASRRSSARSGDGPSDDLDESPDDDSADSAPPVGRRFCVGCGRDIGHKRKDAKYCSATCRQRGHRHVDPLNQTLDGDRYLRLPAWEHEALRHRAVDGCRCNGSHVLDAIDGTCAKCGRDRREPIRGREIAPYYLIVWTQRASTPPKRREAGSPKRLVAGSPEREHGRPLEEMIV